MAKKGTRVVANRLLAAEVTKALIAAPGEGLSLRIFGIYASVVTAAAQQIDVGVDGGPVTQQIMSIPPSFAGDMLYRTEDGFLLPVNTALSAKPAAAGPAVHFVIEYVTE